MTGDNLYFQWIHLYFLDEFTISVQLLGASHLIISWCYVCVSIVNIAYYLILLPAVYPLDLPTCVPHLRRITTLYPLNVPTCLLHMCAGNTYSYARK